MAGNECTTAGEGAAGRNAGDQGELHPILIVLTVQPSSHPVDIKIISWLYVQSFFLSVALPSLFASLSFPLRGCIVFAKVVLPLNCTFPAATEDDIRIFRFNFYTRLIFVVGLQPSNRTNPSQIVVDSTSFCYEPFTIIERSMGLVVSGTLGFLVCSLWVRPLGVLSAGPATLVRIKYGSFMTDDQMSHIIKNAQVGWP